MIKVYFSAASDCARKNARRKLLDKLPNCVAPESTIDCLGVSEVTIA
jgi:hypothetical protein